MQGKETNFLIIDATVELTLCRVLDVGKKLVRDAAQALKAALHGG